MASNSPAKKPKRRSKKQIARDERVAELEAKRAARHEQHLTMLATVTGTKRTCEASIASALQSEHHSSDDAQDDSDDGGEEDSVRSFHLARMVGQHTPREKRVVKSLIAMDPEKQEEAVCDVLDEHDARFGPNARTQPRLTLLFSFQLSPGAPFAHFDL